MVISPAKTLDFETDCGHNKFTENEFLDDAQLLINEIQKLSSKQLGSLMKLSDKLANLNRDRYQSWSLPFNEENAKQALFAFQGDVYQGLDAQSLTKTQVNFAQKHLLILSGLYGILRPLDLMQAYRLEMGTKFKNKRGKDLYEFWGNKLEENINQRLKKKDSVLVNLASQEYFKAINPKKLNTPIITPVFKNKKNGEYKMIALFAKKARGMMVRYAIDNKITDVEDLKGFDYEGYKFSKKLSSEQELVFTRTP